MQRTWASLSRDPSILHCAALLNSLTAAGRSGHGRGSALPPFSALNDRFGTEWASEDLLIVQAIEEDMAKDQGMRNAATANTEQKFGIAVAEEVVKALVDRHGRNEEFVGRVLGDEEMQRLLSAYLTRSLYPRLRVEGEAG